MCSIKSCSQKFPKIYGKTCVTVSFLMNLQPLGLLILLLNSIAHAVIY